MEASGSAPAAQPWGLPSQRTAAAHGIPRHPGWGRCLAHAQQPRPGRTGLSWRALLLAPLLLLAPAPVCALSQAPTGSTLGASQANTAGSSLTVGYGSATDSGTSSASARGLQGLLGAAAEGKAGGAGGGARALSAASKAKDGYSALCVVGKNENRYVKEWVDYHKCLGFSRIYLYDHNSTVPMSKEVEAHIKDGFVVYQDIDGLHKKFNDGQFTSNIDRFMQTIQGRAYADCVATHGSKHTFLGFIDFDEFLVINDEGVKDVNDLLKDYEAYPGVSFYWTHLGSSGHIQRPDQPVVTAFTKCTPQEHKFNTQFKTFANTRFKPTMYSPHRAIFDAPNDKDGNEPYMVDENFKRIQRGRNKKGTHKRAVVYHYVIKSLEDFEVKMRRGGGAGITRPKYYFTLMDKYSTQTCDGAVKTRARFCKA